MGVHCLLIYVIIALLLLLFSSCVLVACTNYSSRFVLSLRFSLVKPLVLGFLGTILKLICTRSVSKVSPRLAYVSLGAIILNTPFCLAKSQLQ